MAETNDICCPEIDPSSWNEKTTTWQRKPFLAKSIPQLFHMPVPGGYAKAIGALWKEAQQNGIAPKQEDCFMLTRDISAWKAEILIAVTESKAGLDMHELNGTFASKVYDGPYNKIPEFMKDMNEWLAKEGKRGREYFFWYPYCPACAKKYGHNWIVIIAQLDS